MNHEEATHEARTVLLALLQWYWTPLHPWMSDRDVRALRDELWGDLKALEELL